MSKPKIEASTYNGWIDRINAIRQKHGLSPDTSWVKMSKMDTVTASDMNYIAFASIGSKWLGSDLLPGEEVVEGEIIYYSHLNNIEAVLEDWEETCVHDSGFFTCQSNFFGVKSSDDTGFRCSSHRTSFNSGDDRSNDDSDDFGCSSDYESHNSSHDSGDCSVFRFSEENNQANCPTGSCGAGCEGN